MGGVRYEDGQVNEGGVASELFECFAGFEAMNSDGGVIGSAEKLTTVTGEF